MTSSSFYMLEGPQPCNIVVVLFQDNKFVPEQKMVSVLVSKPTVSKIGKSR